MKKSYNPNDIHQKEGQEQFRKLHRSITEHAKRLDDARGCACTVSDLFTPSLQIQRKKFRDYCERLIFLDPLSFGRKYEELQWRKGYYDIVSSAKKLKKNEYTVNDISNIQAHINCGIGYYHHFISKLKIEFNLKLDGIIDFVCVNSRTDEIKPSRKTIDDKILQWANASAHRCLIYLGDLCRYKLDIYPNWDPGLAIRYYSQALSFKPEFGMPHNQIGTLMSSRNQLLNAVYHYMRCLDCKFSFECTENNLQRLFETNSKLLKQLPNENMNADCIVHLDKVDYIKRLISRFLLLADIWFFNKTVPHIYNLCRQTFLDLEECLKNMKPQSSESGDTQTDLESVETESITSYLSNEGMFKIAMICLLCLSKMLKTQSEQVSTITAFIIALYSQLIQNIIYHLQESVLNFPLSNEKFENNKSVNGMYHSKKAGQKIGKIRRRRKKLKDTKDSDESDLSDNDKINNLENSESEDSDDYGNGTSLISSSDEEEVEEKITDTSTDSQSVQTDIKNKKAENVTIGDVETDVDVVMKSKKMNINDMLEIISEQGSLQTVKILSDWIESDKEVIKSCAKSTPKLFKQIILLLNLIHVDYSKTDLSSIQFDITNMKMNHKKIALTEDVILKGIEIFKSKQNIIDWNSNRLLLSAKEETLIRVMKMVSFGKYLATIEETGISYSETSRLFSCSLNNTTTFETQDLENGNDQITKVFESTGQLNKMKHMGQLWLAAEVKDLENRVNGKTSLSPYLVLDADALIKFNFMVKHLVNSRKFIVVVPTVVVSALDDLKREKIEARDAIRWLESQFHQGNRFFRAQRLHEKAPIPYIKYPKKKDKEAFIYIQIIECCHYLAQQQKGASNLVTLLIGNQNALSSTENRELSYTGLAQTAGVNMELITHFYAKWKKTSKGKR